MVSEGREYRRGVDKLFKVQSLEQGGGGAGGGEGNFLLFASLAILKMRGKKIILDQAGMKP